MNVCKTCKKIIPDLEIKTIDDKKYHFTSEVINTYKKYSYQSSNKVGLFLEKEIRYCGVIEEQV